MVEQKKNTGNMSEKEVKDILKNIGEMIRTARNNKGWSMAQLAEKSGISSSLISDLENNKGKVPNIFTLISIARALNLSDDEFITGFWQQSKKVRIKNKESEQHDIVIKALLGYGIPQKAMAGVMNYIDMFAAVGKVYDLYEKNKNIKDVNKEEYYNMLGNAEFELCKFFSDFVRQDRLM